MVGVSAYVNLPLHHKVQKFSTGTGSPGWSQKKGRKTDVCVCVSDACLLSSVNLRFIVYFCGYFLWFLIFFFSVLAKPLAVKSISEMTYFVSSGM